MLFDSPVTVGYYAWFAVRSSMRGSGKTSDEAGGSGRQDQRFDAFRLASSQGEIAGSVVPADLERLDDRLIEDAEGSEGQLSRDGRIDWSIRGTSDAEGRPALTVSLEGSVPLQCQRCLGVLDFPVHQTTTVLLARNDAELVHLDDASEQEVVLANAPLDAVALVEDELLLTLPFAPRHETACSDAGGATQTIPPQR